MATATAAIVVLNPPPPHFIIFEGQNLTYILSPSFLRLLAKKQKTKIVARVNV
jgi:hypothetical protein